MAAATQKSAPSLRFKCEGGRDYPDWEEKLLGEFSNFIKGKGISKSDIVSNGAVECIRYGELYTHYGTTITHVISSTDIPPSRLELSNKNDVIVPSSGETASDIATAACLRLDGVALGGDINIIRCQQNGIFLAYYLNYKKPNIARLAQGISVIHLYASQLRLLKLSIPSKKEQQKIASFLSAVDTKIEQLNRKKSLLEQYKKGMMQKLFSQEIRFKDEDGRDYPDWEEKYICDFCEINPSGGNLPDTFTYIDLESVYQGALIKKNTISRNGAPSRAQRMLRKNDVLFQSVRPYQQNNYFFDLDGDYIASTGYVQLRTSTSARFLYYLVHEQKYVKRVLARCTGTSYPAINSNDIGKIKVYIPTVKEQQKIANFLSAIDRKIELVTNQIEQARAFKQGLLQQMFI